MKNLVPWRRSSSTAVSRDTSNSLLKEFRGEMDHLFNRFFHDPWYGPVDLAEYQFRSTMDFMPSVDLSENDQQITISAEMPGMQPEDVDIDISGNVLTIHGEKKAFTEDEGDEYYHSERRFGSFTRNIELPATVDLDDIEAEQVNGVLTVKVKKLPTAHAKRIEVKQSQRELAGTSV